MQFHNDKGDMISVAYANIPDIDRFAYFACCLKLRWVLLLLQFIDDVSLLIVCKLLQMALFQVSRMKPNIPKPYKYNIHKNVWRETYFFFYNHMALLG